MKRTERYELIVIGGGQAGLATGYWLAKHDIDFIIVDGGMPQHGHGLPTKPLVTAHLGEGKHVVDGMKFNMGGWWVVKLTIDGAKGSDVVTFNLKL